MHDVEKCSIRLIGGDGHLRKLEDIEADIINLAIVLYDGRLTEVSRRLCIGRSTLYRKIGRHDDLFRRRLQGEHRSLESANGGSRVNSERPTQNLPAQHA